MKFLYFFFTVTLFMFQGCATNDTAAHLTHTQTKAQVNKSDTLPSGISKNEETETLIDTFEEEFSAVETNTSSDPLSGYNRVMTSFNDLFLTYLLNPVSEGYAAILPEPLRIGISNAFSNIQFPVRLANNLLQLKFENSSDELGRFIINSTVGLAGFIDVATDHMKTPIPAHEEDFGQTLGHYGIGSGFHIVLPFIGPSNVRDTVGFTVDAYASPLVYMENLEKYKIPDNRDQSLGILGGEIINKTSLHLGEYESLKKDAIDLYPFLRDTYEQKRNSDIEK